MTAASAGVSSPGQGASLWATFGPGLRASYTFAGRFAALFGGVDLTFPLTRPRFVVTGLETETVHQPWPVVLRGSAGLELRL